MVEGQIYFQLQEPTRNESVSVATTNTVIAEARIQDVPRRVIVVRNNGDTNLTCNLGQQAAVSNNGILLKPGESFSDSSESGYQCHQGIITAISETSANNVSIMER